MERIILVAEDEEAIAGLLRALLEDEGFRVIVATDGRAALDILAAQRPDLVLSDVMMPRLDGRALARAMFADPSYRAIPLVLLSAAGREQAQGVPHAAFLPKPFDLDALLATIARLLETDVSRETHTP
jgi:CheY-like chemotaxis protein